MVLPNKTFHHIWCYHWGLFIYSWYMSCIFRICTNNIRHSERNFIRLEYGAEADSWDRWITQNHCKGEEYHVWQSATEKLFNDLLSEYRARILPEVMAGWSQVSETEKEHLTRMNYFFCGQHFLVGLADSTEATLKLWEESHELSSSESSGTQI